MQKLRDEFLHPGNDYRALPLDYDFSNPEATAARYVESGWGGAHFNYPKPGPEYLHDEAGWKTLLAGVNACRERGLNVWIYDEWGYPSGRAGGQVLKDHPEYESQGLFYASKDVAGDKPVQIEWRVPDGKPVYVAVFDVDWSGVLSGKPDDLTDKVTSGVLKCEIQPGSKRLVAFVKNRLYEGTHASCTFGPYINILDPDAVKRFIHLTHDTYFARCGGDFGKTIKAFFNDEVSLMSGYLVDATQPYPAVAWWDGIPDVFRQRTGRDIREALPALFNDVGAGTAAFRAQYYSMLADLVGKNFFGQVQDWCAAHGVASTGHLVWEESLIYHANFYGSVFPALRHLDWPGIDVLGCGYGATGGSHIEGGPVTPKLISSVAHLYGKPRTMSESFCFVTGKTPIEELLAHINWQWVLGINSLTTLSITDQYSSATLRQLNEYTGRLGWMMTRGQLATRTAVLCPIASVWADFAPTNRHVHHLGDNPKARDVDEAWRMASAEVLAHQLDFDYLDEETLEHCVIDNGWISFGKNAYSLLVLPHVTALSSGTLQRIAGFVKNGGTVISYQTLPTIMTDHGPADGFEKLVDELWYGSPGKGRVVHTETRSSLAAALSKWGQPDVKITPASAAVYCQHRVLKNSDIFFLVNNDVSAVSGEFAFKAKGKAEIWDPLTGKMRRARAVRRGGRTVMNMTLRPRSGRFVVFGDLR